MYWGLLFIYFVTTSRTKAAQLLKAYLYASFLGLLQGTKDTGATQLAALSVMQGEEQHRTGCVVLAALRNWSRVYLLLVIGRIFKSEKGGFPLRGCWLQSFEIHPGAPDGGRAASGEVNTGQPHALCKLFHWCSICMSKWCQNRLPTYPHMALVVVRAGNTNYFFGDHL